MVRLSPTQISIGHKSFDLLQQPDADPASDLGKLCSSSGGTPLFASIQPGIPSCYNVLIYHSRILHTIISAVKNDVDNIRLVAIRFLYNY